MSDDVQTLLSTLGANPSYADVQRVGRQLLAVANSDTEAEAVNSVRIALASSFTINPLSGALAVECHRLGLKPRIYVADYNQYRSSFLDAESPLYRFNADAVFLAAELDSLIPLGSPTPQSESMVDRACSEVIQLVESFKSHSDALLVIFNFVEPAVFPYAISGKTSESLHHGINQRLHQQFAGDPQVRLMDYDALSAHHGKSRTTNPKMHYMGRMEIGETFLPEVSHQCMAYIRALKGLTRKCLVLDGDGTLWGGVVGEDGLEGIKLDRTGPGSEYYEFQQSILELSKRGVILAVASKNNPEDFMRVLSDHPDMVLREEHFADFQVNWRDKANNIISIAENLNIGLESMVFLDDSPAERAWVRQALPDVTVYDLPSDPSEYVRFIQELTDFEVLTSTEEDIQRGAFYAKERARKQLQTSSASYEEFLAGLKMRLSIGEAQGIDVPRVAQLTRKTNQFNLTTKRYTDAEIAGLGDGTNASVYTLRVEDVFGDTGLVGVAILLRDDETEYLDTFLMSCRVLGRGIEAVFLNEIVARAKQSGASRILGEYLPTSKNGLAAEFLRDCGFGQNSGDDTERRTWELSTGEWAYSRPPYYEVTWRIEPVTNQATG